MMDTGRCPVCGHGRSSKRHGPGCARKVKAFYAAHPPPDRPPAEKAYLVREYVKAGGGWRRQ